VRECCVWNGRTRVHSVPLIKLLSRITTLVAAVVSVLINLDWILVAAWQYSRNKARSSSPFKSDATQAGQTGNWEYVSKRVCVTDDIALRLNIAPGGESPTVGVVARMDLIGQHINEVVEQVHSRAARPDEAERLV